MSKIDPYNYSRDITHHMNNTFPTEYDNPKPRKFRPANTGAWVSLVAIPLFLLLFGLLGGFSR
jgi:ABC-type uncharacterized transport system involved in gliding motility auxiliary subunit